MLPNIFEQVPVGLYRTALDGRILNANPTFAKILGFPSLQELVPANVLDLYVDRADRERWRLQLEREGVVQNFETRLRRQDGTIIWVKDTSRFVKTPSGQACYEGVIEDITVQRATAEQFKESEARFRAVFVRSPIAKCLLHPDGNFLLVNSAMSTMLGYEADELLARRFEQVTHPDDVEKSVAWVQALLAGRGVGLPLEKRYLHRSGRTIWGVVSTSLLRNDDGTPHLFVTELHDITARKQAEEALQRSEERYRSLVASLGDGVVLQDVSTGIVAANDAAARLLGLSLEQLTGRTWDDPWLSLVDEDGRPFSGAEHPAMVALKTGKPQVDVILGIPRPVGAPTWVSINAQPIVRPAEASPYAVVTTLHDITNRRRLEAQFHQAQKMEAIGQLAGGVAHDFNNVVTAILGYSDLLLASLQGDPRIDDVLEIQRAGEVAKTLTGQLLAFSRRQDLKPRVLNINEVVGTAQNLLKRLVGHDVQVKLHLDPGTPAIKADAGQIGQVLLNLAVNARDAMSSGGYLTIETATVALDDAYAAMHPPITPGSYVCLAVTDTGHGMTPDVQQHLFEPFFTTKERGRGTGLGLATVYGIVTQAGGSILVDSEIDRGTTFKLFFPVVAESPDISLPQEPPTDILGGSETILIVEDDDQLRNLAHRTLHQLGYNELVAGDGSEAIRLAESHRGPIHLLFADVVMAGLSGPDVFKALAPLKPGLKAVYTSGYTQGPTVHHGVPDGFSAFLPKPYSSAALVRIVRETLDGPATKRA